MKFICLSKFTNLVVCPCDASFYKMLRIFLHLNVSHQYKFATQLQLCTAKNYTTVCATIAAWKNFRFFFFDNFTFTLKFINVFGVIAAR